MQNNEIAIGMAITSLRSARKHTAYLQRHVDQAYPFWKLGESATEAIKYIDFALTALENAQSTINGHGTDERQQQLL